MPGSARLLTAGLAVLATYSACVQSQAYPTKSIRFMVGFAAGGATDVSARMLAQRLTEALGQPVVVENRGGSGGLIATEFVSKSPADGYTLLMMPAADAVQPAVRRKLPYDLERDFAPVARAVTGPWVVVVHPNVPVKNIRDLVALAKMSSAKLNYATSGVGSSAHIANEAFNSMAGVKMVHVPYKGVSEGVTATAQGQTDVVFASITAAKPLLEAKRVRPIAISTIKRTKLMPEMPTIDESGVAGYDRSGWYGVLAPAGVPREIISRLNGAIAAAVNTPAMTEAFIRQGLEPGVMSPEEFGAFIRREVAQNIKVARDAGIPLE